MGVSLLVGRLVFLFEDRLLFFGFSCAKSGARGIGIAVGIGMARGAAGASSRIGFAPSSNSSGNKSSSLRYELGTEFE